MKYVIATAGHVDHGKSTLIKALTGMDPDRLAEEQQRQMTIDLGFAWLILPNGDEIGIVDVPGHRDFINNMLAGVGSIDAVIMVVAADEGIMPQTKEHIMILDQLKIKKGIIAITKIDLVKDREWLDLVSQDIREAIRTTTMCDFPIVQVSTVTGEGIPLLVESLQKVLKTVERVDKNVDPRLAIDRVFSIKGFGTVVTGTLLGGTLELGREVDILPSGKHGRIRGIETHKHKIEKALPGSRVALNISGVEVSEIKRGDVVLYPNTFRSTSRLDAEINILPSATTALQHNDTVKLFHGTSEVSARIRTLGLDEIKPGENGLVQMELHESIVICKGDRFIIRRPSPPQTIGGGYVINTAPQRRYKRYSEKILNSLTVQISGSEWDIFSLLLDEKIIIRHDQLMETFSKEGLGAKQAIEILQKDERVINFSVNCPKIGIVQFYSSSDILKQLGEDCKSEIISSQAAVPLLPGIPIKNIAKKQKISECVLEAMVTQDLLGADYYCKMGYLCHQEKPIQFSEKDLSKIKRLDSTFQEKPYSPPSIEELQTLIGIDLVQALLFQDELIQVSDSIVFKISDFEEMHNKLLKHLQEHGEITLAQFRDLFNTSRKYALAFLEYMDAKGITQRVGETRKLKH